MDLSERKRKILQAIIDEYIGTAEPVGSRAISKKESTTQLMEVSIPVIISSSNQTRYSDHLLNTGLFHFFSLFFASRYMAAEMAAILPSPALLMN